MITYFRDPTIHQECDLICFADGGKPMRDHQYDLVSSPFGKIVEYSRCSVSASKEAVGSSRISMDVSRMIARAIGQALALSCRQLAAALP